MNLGSGVPTSVLDLAQTILRLEGCEGAPIFKAAREGDILQSVADVSRIQRSLGWSPQTTLSDGLLQMDGAGLSNSE